MQRQQLIPSLNPKGVCVLSIREQIVDRHRFRMSLRLCKRKILVCSLLDMEVAIIRNSSRLSPSEKLVFTLGERREKFRCPIIRYFWCVHSPSIVTQW